MANTNPTDKELNQKLFKEISYKLGSNKNLVQAAGGNTSMKIGDSMIIKASGTWLKDTFNKEIFVEVDLKSIKNKIHKNIEDNFAEDIISKNSLRPSTETSFHALINFKYVLHVHSTSTIANAIYSDSENLLKEKLGNEIVFVPYIRPGFPLTKLIREKINEKSKIIILENHGLIIAGDDINETYDLLISTHNKLDVILNSNFEIYENKDGVNLANYNKKTAEKYDIFKTSDDRLIEIFSKSFYPDHVIFLGPGVPFFENIEYATTFLSELSFKKLSPPPFLIIKKLGLFQFENCIEAANEMLDCFIEVLIRIDLKKEKKHLSSQQEDELLNWDAEIYRQKIN